MKKTELESHSRTYAELTTIARHEERAGNYRTAIAKSVAAWPHISGMIRFASRFEEKETRILAAVEIVICHAPILMDFRRIDALETFLQEERRLLKSTRYNDDGISRDARKTLWEAHHLWGHLANVGGVAEAELFEGLGGDSSRSVRITGDASAAVIVHRHHEGSGLSWPT